MKPAGAAALLILLMPAAMSTAAQEEPGATSATAGVVTGPHSQDPALGVVRRAVAGVASNVQNEDSSAPRKTHSDSYWYGRFGWGTIAGERRYGGIGFGFGRRIERNSVGIDLLLFSGQVKLFRIPADTQRAVFREELRDPG